MFRRITQVTLHQSTDDNQPLNGGLSLADARVDRTDQIPDRAAFKRRSEKLSRRSWANNRQLGVVGQIRKRTKTWLPKLIA